GLADRRGADRQSEESWFRDSADRTRLLPAHPRPIASLVADGDSQDLRGAGAAVSRDAAPLPPTAQGGRQKAEGRSKTNPFVRLIVTADDVGLDRGMTTGAIEAHRKGIVTACSIVANGREFEDAVARLRDVPSLEAGVHLTLVEERALTSGEPMPRNWL